VVLILLELTFLRFVETYFKFLITHHTLLKIVLVEGNGGDSSGSETTDTPKKFSHKHYERTFEYATYC